MNEPLVQRLNRIMEKMEKKDEEIANLKAHLKVALDTIDKLVLDTIDKLVDPDAILERIDEFEEEIGLSVEPAGGLKENLPVVAMNIFRMRMAELKSALSETAKGEGDG